MKKQLEFKAEEKITAVKMPQYSYGKVGSYTRISSPMAGIRDSLGAPADANSVMEYKSPLADAIEQGTQISSPMWPPGIQYRVAEGSATGTPGLAFGVATGWDNGVAFSGNTAGTNTVTMSVNATVVNQWMAGQLQMVPGTSTAPSLVGIGYLTTGLAWETNAGAPVLDLTANAVKIVEVRQDVPGMNVVEGDGVGLAKIGGRIDTNTTTQANVGLTEEVLGFIAIPASALTDNGRGVEIEAWGTTAGNGNAKTINLRFCVTTLAGTILITNNITGSPNGLAWYCKASVFRTAASTQISIGNMIVGAVDEKPLNSPPAESESSAIRVELTGTAPTAPGDITFKGMIVRYIG